MKRKAEVSPNNILDEESTAKRKRLNEKCTQVADIDAYFSAYSEADIITQIKDKAIDLNMVNANNKTLFMYSADKGYYNLFTYLNSNTDTKKDILTSTGATIIHFAARGGNKGILAVLLEDIININADMPGYTPLHLAASKGHIEVVNLLLEKGANIEATDQKSNTPLHLAALYGHIEVVKFLLGKNANIEVTDQKSNTPLHVAAFSGHIEVVKFLLGKNANIKATGIYDNTPLHLAAEKGHIEVVNLLMGKGANLEATNENGHPPLHLAAGKGHIELTELLINNGAKTTELFTKVLFHTTMESQKKLNMLKLLFGIGVPVESNLYTINLDNSNIAQELKDIVNDLFLVEQIKKHEKGKLSATTACQDLIAQRLEILLTQEGLSIDYTNYKEYIENINESTLSLEVKQAIMQIISTHQKNLSIFATALLMDCFNKNLLPIESYAICSPESKDFYLSIAKILKIIEVEKLFDEKMIKQLSQTDIEKIIDNFNVQVINNYFDKYITIHGIKEHGYAISKLILPCYIKNNITNWIKEYKEFNANSIACIDRENVNSRLKKQEDKIEELKNINQVLQDKVENLEAILNKLIKTISISENEQEIINSSKPKNKM